MTESPRGLPVKETIRLTSIRKVMARTMKASVDNAALSQINREFDVTPLKKLREERLVEVRPRVSLNTLVMAAVARTLPHHPLLNAELVGDEILVHDIVNLGMAVATPGGLIVIVVPGVQRLTLIELTTVIDRLVDRARSGTLSTKDVEGGTFTVSNLGMYGVDSGFPLPRPPEGAILLVGEARPKPTVIDDQITVRDIAWFTITYDHRFIDGATAAAFLRDLNELICEPESLAEDECVVRQTAGLIGTN